MNGGHKQSVCSTGEGEIILIYIFTQYITNIVQHVININLTNVIFSFFCCMEFLKSDMYFTLMACLNLE